MVDIDPEIPINTLEDFLFEFENYIEYEAVERHQQSNPTYWNDRLWVRHKASYIESNIGIIHLDVFAILKPYIDWYMYDEPNGPQWDQGWLNFSKLRYLKIESLLL